MGRKAFAYVCMYICIHTYIIIHTHTHTHTGVTWGLKEFAAKTRRILVVVAWGVGAEWGAVV